MSLDAFNGTIVTDYAFKLSACRALYLSGLYDGLVPVAGELAA